MDSWDDAQTFLAVTEERSFSRAARKLGVGQPTVSRRIANLEANIGVQLFSRGRSGAQPTDEALQLVPAAEQMARWAAEFARGTQTHESSIRGTVRIAAPPGIAVEHLGSFARDIKAQHPGIRLEVIAGIEHLDLTRGAADIAIRSKPSNEPELVVLGTLSNPVGVYARADYAAKLPRPCTWSDLDWITWCRPFETVPPRPMLEKRISNFAPIFASDDYLVLKSALVSGLGAMIISELEAQRHQQELVKVDMGVELPNSELYVVAAKSAQHVPRVQSVVRLLLSSIQS